MIAENYSSLMASQSSDTEHPGPSVAALSLFRQEALEFQQQYRQWGGVAGLQPFSTKVMTWCATIAVALIIIFLFVGQYSRKETVVGYLTPTTGTSKIFTLQSGAIKQIYVKEGQLVREDEPLLTVETNQIAANGVDVNAAVFDTMSSQKNMLLKQIEAEEHRTASERDRLTAMISGMESEISHLVAQIKTQAERINIEEELVSKAGTLKARSVMPDIEYKRRQLSLLDQKQQLSSLNQQLATKKNQLTELRYSLQQLPTVMAHKIQGLRNELASTEKKIAEAHGRRSYVVRAPTSGRVSTLQATVGQTADPHRLQLEIIPPDSVLQAELFVPTRAIGFVKVGQPVRILYEAFPYQNFGSYRGRVVKISKTILTGSHAAGPISLKDPAYRVTVALDRQSIDAYGATIELQPDMLLRADIILEKRPLIKWLIDPLLSVRT